MWLLKGMGSSGLLDPSLLPTSSTELSILFDFSVFQRGWGYLSLDDCHSLEYTDRGAAEMGPHHKSTGYKVRRRAVIWGTQRDTKPWSAWSGYFPKHPWIIIPTRKGGTVLKKKYVLNRVVLSRDSLSILHIWWMPILQTLEKTTHSNMWRNFWTHFFFSFFSWIEGKVGGLKAFSLSFPLFFFLLCFFLLLLFNYVTFPFSFSVIVFY